MIIADENIEQYWISLLRNSGYEVLSIRELHPGIADNEVVNIGKAYNGLLLTEDKDFGELVFAHDIKGLSIVFLRYHQPNYSEVETALMGIIKTYYKSGQHYFITITASTVRIRSI